MRFIDIANGFGPFGYGNIWDSANGIRTTGEVRTWQSDALSVAEAASFDSGEGEGGSEVVSHHGGRLYTTNGANDSVDVYDAASGELVLSLDLSGIDGFDGLNSVSASASGIAVAVERDMDDYDNGVVAVFDLDGTLRGTVETGNLPDMVKFSEDGSMIFVANEGEPGDDVDPAGSISVIDVASLTARTFGFGEFDDQADALAAEGVRLFPGRAPSVDFEPEYIAEEGGKLYVTLQEANTVAVFDLATMAWEDLLPLGTSDHSAEGFGIDPSDRDDAIDIHTVPVMGMRMPDAIAATEIGGETYFLTANEGDDRGDYDEGGDAARVGDILDGDVDGVSIDPSVDTGGLERLTVSIIDGDTDGDGDIDVLHSYGSRSFTIFSADGSVVFDSGDDFEQIIAEMRVPNAFNNDDYPSDDPNVIDENRSDNKGPEPEAITVGEVDGHTLAFIGLERDGGIMIYDISDPENAEFVDYLDSSLFGHSSPEVIDFISAEESLTGVAQIAASYEISGTTALYDLAFGELFKGSVHGDDIEGTIGDDVIAAEAGRDIVDARGGDDTVRGGDGADLLLGGAGDDVIAGGNGFDMISGGAGDDKIAGGNGFDLISGGTGNDWLSGGFGGDGFVFDLGDGQDTIADFNRNDVIDLSATGLEYDDLTVEGSGDVYTISYGDQGDSIEVHLFGVGSDLGEDAFLF